MAVVLGSGAGVGLLLVSREEEDRSPEIAATLLADGHSHVRETADVLARVDTLADLQGAARLADHQADELRVLAERADSTLNANPALARAVEQVLAAEAGALAGIAQAAALRPTSLSRWSGIYREIEQGAAEISEGHRNARAVIAPGSAKDPGPLLLEAAEAAERLVRRGQRRLSAWKHRHRRAQRERRHDVAILDAYASTMRSYLATYDELRNGMSAWIGKVDRGGVTFDEGYDFLAGASADRTRVRSGIAALDAPSALAEHHNTLLAVVDASVTAVDNAYEGTLDYELDWAGEYASYREAPGWRAFTEQSESVAERYAAAHAAWQTAFTKERKTKGSRVLPKAPKL